MDLETALAREVLAAHPLDAAAALERVPSADAAALLGSAEPEVAAGVLRHMDGASGAAIVAALAPERAAAPLAALPRDVGAACLRRLDATARDAILAHVPGAAALRALLRFPEHTAGAVMDPEALALSADLAAGQALERVRRGPEHARYNLYVVDREQRLVGVLNLRELLLADPKTPLASCMHEAPHRLAATADRHAIVSAPGWREVHALPVVDEHGLYLGAVRYRTLRRLEEELRGVRPDETTTARALGELFRTGAAGMLEAVAAGRRTDGP